jgi:hypothetical protein
MSCVLRSILIASPTSVTRLSGKREAGNAEGQVGDAGVWTYSSRTARGTAASSRPESYQTGPRVRACRAARRACPAPRHAAPAGPSQCPIPGCRCSCAVRLRTCRWEFSRQFRVIPLSGVSPLSFLSLPLAEVHSCWKETPAQVAAALQMRMERC